MKSFQLVLILWMVVGVLHATPQEDQATQQALQFSLLGETVPLDKVAKEREATEKNLKKNGKKPLILSDNIALLAGATQPVVRSKKVTKNVLQSFKEDGETEQLFSLVEQVNPRERYARARNNRQYESARRQVNSFTGALISVLTLQFFGLVQPPLDFAEWYTVNRKTLNPEQRREVAEARIFLDSKPPKTERLKPKAESVVEKYPTRRIRTSTLQAERNGRRELKRGEIYNAIWWFDREMLLRNEKVPTRKNHVELLEQLKREAEGRERSLTFESDTEDQYTGTDIQIYSALLEGALLNVSDEELRARISGFSANYLQTDSKLEQEFLVLQAAAKEQAQQPLMSRIVLEFTAEKKTGFWAERSSLYLKREDFNPALALAAAKADYLRRVKRYLIYAESPEGYNRHLNADDARELESGWIRTIRSIFVIDAIGRAIVLPFLPGSTFSREPWLDVWGRMSDADLQSPDGLQWREHTLKAFRKMKRWESASTLATEMGEEKKSQKYTKKWIKDELARIDTRTPNVRLALIEELLARVESPEVKELVEEARKDEAARQNVLAVVERKYVKQNREDWKLSLLNLPPQWSDGKKANGEIGSEGLYLLENDKVRFKNKADQEWLTFDVTPGSVLSAVRLIYPRKRAEEIEQFLNQPLEKKRIPIQVEGSAFPGVNVMPGLVPLDPSQSIRRFYR